MTLWRRRRSTSHTVNLRTRSDRFLYDTCQSPAPASYIAPVVISPSVGERSIVINVSVCTFVYLFVCLFACTYQKLLVQIFCTRYLWPWLGPPLTAVCTSGFAEDVMFSYNGVNRRESKTTRMFRPVRQMAAPVESRIMLFGQDRRVAAPGAKSAVPDTILFHFICNSDAFRSRPTWTAGSSCVRLSINQGLIEPVPPPLWDAMTFEWIQLFLVTRRVFV